MPEPLQNPMTFGELKATVGEILARGRDVKTNDNLLGFAVNEAEQWIGLELGAHAYWLQRHGTLDVGAGEEIVTVAQDVRDILSLRDETNFRYLGYISNDEFNAHVVSSSQSTGPPLVWTKFGFARRENVESPSQPYGRRQVKVYPVPSSATALSTSEIIESGQMADDGDVSVLPISMHSGLVRVAVWKMATFDTSVKNAAQHQEQAFAWIATMKSASIRDMAGNQRFIPGEQHRRSRSAPLLPVTRGDQLSGGGYW